MSFVFCAGADETSEQLDVTDLEIQHFHIIWWNGPSENDSTDQTLQLWPNSPGEIA